VTDEELLGVYFADLAQRNIWDLMFETTMDVDVVTGYPAGMSKPLHRIKLIPFTTFSIINLQRHDLPNLISPSSNNHHQRSQKQC